MKSLGAIATLLILCNFENMCLKLRFLAYAIIITRKAGQRLFCEKISQKHFLRAAKFATIRAMNGKVRKR